MAKQVVTTLIDDIDGSEATETIAFSYRGVNYSIDVNDKNSAAFDKAMERFMAKATRESGRRATSRSTAPSPGAAGRRPDLAAIRAWAVESGYEIATRGRIAAEVVDAYDAAH